MKAFIYITLLLIVGYFVLNHFTPARPTDINNICHIFQQEPRWYWIAKHTEMKSGVPVSVQMAIIYQESSFEAAAQPPHKKLLGFIPWFGRESSALGYSQALTGTWSRYQRKTGNGGNREDFEAASNFIGWYSDKIKRELGISPRDAYSLYLAYHEGIAGYQSHSYLYKPWLKHIARKVAWQAHIYQKQLDGCGATLLQKHWWDNL